MSVLCYALLRPTVTLPVDRIPVCLRLMGEASSAPPFSLKGDAELVLESGLALSVHSVHLQQQSSLFEQPLELAQQSAQKGQKLQVRLPATADADGELFVRVIYSQRPETLLRDSSLDSVRGLAKLCHRFAAEELLSLVDQVQPYMRPAQCLMLLLHGALRVAGPAGTGGQVRRKPQRHSSAGSCLLQGGTPAPDATICLCRGSIQCKACQRSGRSLLS